MVADATPGPAAGWAAVWGAQQRHPPFLLACGTVDLHAAACHGHHHYPSPGKATAPCSLMMSSPSFHGVALLGGVIRL